MEDFPKDLFVSDAEVMVVPSHHCCGEPRASILGQVLCQQHGAKVCKQWQVQKPFAGTLSPPDLWTPEMLS